MAHLIIKRPDGKLALWSTISDSFIFQEVPRDVLIEYWLKQYREELEKRVTAAEAKGENMTWAECQKMMSRSRSE